MSGSESVQSALQAYTDAVYAKDVDAFVAVFDDEVRVFDMWGSWSHDGIEAWRAMAVGWFDSLGDERVRVEFADVGRPLMKTSPSRTRSSRSPASRRRAAVTARCARAAIG